MTNTNPQEYPPYQKLNLLIPFLEAYGFRIWRSTDHIKIYPPKKTVEPIFDGAEILKKIEPKIKSLILDQVDKIMKKCEELRKQYEEVK